MNEMIGRCDLLEPANPLNDKVKVSQVNSPFVHLPQYTLFSPPTPPPPQKKTLHNLCFRFLLANDRLNNFLSAHSVSKGKLTCRLPWFKV